MKSLHLSTSLTVWCTLVLTACGSVDKHQDLKDYISETKHRPIGQIEPLPTFRPYQSFTYSAVTLRSPFERPVEEKRQILVSSDSNVFPDDDREKEYLENFNFATLKMVGTLKKGEVLWVLINDGEGSIHRVTTGNYLGRNHGQIVSATASKVDVVEIVSDGLNGWVERPRVLKLHEKE